MSVSSEIQQLTTNLNNIKQSIIDQGGTIDEGAGFNAISAAVETISGGGSEPTPITPYGYIYYHPYTPGYVGNTGGEEVTINSIDQTKYAAWLTSAGLDLDNEVSFQYESWNENWRVSQWAPSMVETTLTDAELLSVAGIDVTVSSPDMAQFQVKKGALIDKTTTLELEIASLADFEKLVNTGYDLSAVMSLSNADICCGGVVRFVFGGNITSIPNYFLHYTSTESISAIPSGVTTIGSNFMSSCMSLDCDIDFCNITSIGSNCLSGDASFNSVIKADKVESIGGAFLAYAPEFNQPLSLPAIKTIGYTFMSDCSKFNKPLSLGKIESIGHNFMRSCSSFNQPITIPSTVQSIGSSGSVNNFMYGCNNMVSTITVEVPSSVFQWQTQDSYSLAAVGKAYPAYRTGITLAGTYAGEWKTLFPDIAGTAGNYRKLLVANA